MQAHAKRMKANFCVQELDSDAEPGECRSGGHGNEHHLTPQLKKWCDRRLHWLYTSASEVVREALRLMEENETLRVPWRLVGLS